MKSGWFVNGNGERIEQLMQNQSKIQLYWDLEGNENYTEGERKE